jgi:ankyrin repeat protein
MAIWSRIHSRLTLRLRTLIVLDAVVAVGLGVYLDHLRRQELRRRLAQPIIDAATSGDVARVRQLLDQGADVNSVTSGRYPWTPPMNAAFRGNTDVARLLLERGADPNCQDLDSFRAVTLAAADGHWDIVRLLVEHGADPSQGDGYGKTALDYAKENGRPELVRLLGAKQKGQASGKSPRSGRAPSSP